MTSEQTNKNDNDGKMDDDLNAADSWDDIQITPLNASGDKVTSNKQPPSLKSDHLKIISDNISLAFKELDDSFMYLGVLKKLPLPEATRYFEERFSTLLNLFEKIWENESYPEKEQVFTFSGEDFSKLNKLIHSGDAIQPIYDGLKTVYENVERVRDSGMNWPDAMEILKEIFQNRK